jgi:hypothetical protein
MTPSEQYMAHNEKEIERFIIDTVKNNPGIRRTKLKDAIRKKFGIGHAAAKSMIDRQIGKNEIKEREKPPNWKMYYPRKP